MKLSYGFAVLLIYLVLPASAEDKCLKWFKDSGTKPISNGCFLDCQAIIKDMSTFHCSNRCEEFCKIKNCKIDDFWERALNESSSFTKFSTEEYSHVATALSRIPKKWHPQALKSIVKANKPIDLTAILTPASSTADHIILFKRAFLLSNDELTRVILHEVTHLLMEKEWSKILVQYKEDFGWKNDKHRSGDFVEPDGKMSAEEDLANNIEYYIFEPKTLKEKSPKIHVWIRKNLKNGLELQKGCKYEK